MKAVIWQGPASMTVREVPDPQPAPGEVLVRVDAAGICGSDVTAYLGKMGVSRPGQIRGHEFAGTVVATAAEDAHLQGKPVVVNPLVSCGLCRACLRGADNLCADQVSLGIQRPGGFAELVAVPVTNVVELAASVDLANAAVTEPLAQSVHDVRLALRDGPVDDVLVIGAGAIGLLVIQSARLLGIGEITVLEPNRERHAQARRDGARTVVAGREELLDVAGGAPEFGAVFDVVGVASTRQDSISWTQRGGTAVLVGLHEDISPVAWRDVLRREVTVRGSNASARSDFLQAAEWISAGMAGLPVVAPTAGLDDTPEIFAALAAGSTAELKTLITGQPAG